MTVRTARRGFTMVEVLTVIAIIAILAAILFPVFGAVRKNVRESQCLGNMHSISQALTMYKDNWGTYPLVLDTVITPLNGGFPIRPLFPQYLKSEEVLRCPINIYNKSDAGQQTFAANQLTASGQAVQWRSNGIFFPVQACQQTPNGPIDWCKAGTGQSASFPLRDSYDGGLVPNRLTSQWQQHYMRDWTAAGLVQGASLALDNRRQLKFRNPPADTVVTWCLNHADVAANGTVTSGNVLVMFLDGRTQKVQGNVFGQWSAAGAPYNPAIPPFNIRPKS